MVRALDALWEYIGDVFGEWELDNVGFDSGEGGTNEWGVARGGEEGEGGEAAPVEEVGEVEEGDGVAFGHEGEDCNVRKRR